MSGVTGGVGPEGSGHGGPRKGDGDEPPGGPWKSWPAIYTTLAVWGVACILLLIWITSTLNVDVGEDRMDAEVAEALP